MHSPQLHSGTAPRGIGAAVHPLRELVLEEVHARPFEVLSAPLRVSHLALLTGVDADGVERERQHLATLCAGFGIAPPRPAVSHFSADLGAFRLRWERHQELSTYSFYRAGARAIPFEDPAIAVVPRDWLAELPGELLVAVHLVLQQREDEGCELPRLDRLFGTGVLAGSEDAIKLDAAWLRGGDQVWVMNADNRLEQRSVQIGYRGDGYVLVTAGLAPGERVVTTPIDAAAEGMPLRLGAPAQERAHGR
jgi:hypothetical protein